MQEHIYETVPLFNSHTLPQFYHLQNRNCVLCLIHDCRGAGAVQSSCKVTRKAEIFIQRSYTEIWQKLLLEVFLTSAESEQFVLLVSSPVQGFTPTAPVQESLWKSEGMLSVSETERLQEYLFLSLYSPFFDDTYADFYSSHATQTVDTQDKSVNKV